MVYFRVIFVLQFFCVFYVAEAKRLLVEESLDGRLHWGRCRIGIDPAEGEADVENPVVIQWPILCVKSKVSAHSLFRSDDPSENRSMFFADLYHGLHLSKYVAMHGQYEFLRVFNVQDSSGDDPAVITIHRTKELFVQLGNPALHKFRFSAGKLKPSFGLNVDPLPEIFAEVFRNESYWSGPFYAARLSFDTLVSSAFDLTISGDKVDGIDVPQRHDDRPSNAAFTLRSMFDVAAMDGFRFVFSGYGDRLGTRRFGIGMINTSQRGDQTSFEWVRSVPQPKLSADYQQNFRLSYVSAFRSEMRWIIDFESERSVYRMGTVGMDLRLPDYGLFRTAVGSQSGWFRNQDDFLFILTSMQLAI